MTGNNDYARKQPSGDLGDMQQWPTFGQHWLDTVMGDDGIGKIGHQNLFHQRSSVRIQSPSASKDLRLQGSHLQAKMPKHLAETQ